jgi:hypothetical protein
MLHPWIKSSNFASRRAILRWGATAAAVSFSLLRNTSGHTAADQVEKQFLGWSRIATGFADLSADTSREFMEISLRSGTTMAELSKLDPLEYRGAAVEKRLLEAWYSGVFKLDGADTVRNAETALIWQSAGIDPQPSWCSGNPIIWTTPPSNF